MNLDSATIERIEHAIADQNLAQLAQQLTTEGVSQVAIYDLFHTFYLSLDDRNREQEQDQLCDAMDRIVGWGAGWFERELMNEDIEAYRKSRL
jgi:hypothetical protein